MALGHGARNRYHHRRSEPPKTGHPRKASPDQEGIETKIVGCYGLAKGGLAKPRPIKRALKLVAIGGRGIGDSARKASPDQEGIETPPRSCRSARRPAWCCKALLDQEGIETSPHAPAGGTS